MCRGRIRVLLDLAKSIRNIGDAFPNAPSCGALATSEFSIEHDNVLRAKVTTSNVRAFTVIFSSKKAPATAARGGG
jgi:hypothetical protein